MNEYIIWDHNIFVWNKYSFIAPHKMPQYNFGVFRIFDCDMTLYFGHLALVTVSETLPKGYYIIYPCWPQYLGWVWSKGDACYPFMKSDL